MKINFDRKKLFIILFVLYLISFLTILLLNQIVKSNFKLSETSQRIIIPTDIKSIFEKQLKFHPEQIETDGNNLLILALPKNEIIIFDTNGNIIDSTINKTDTVGKNQRIINFYASNQRVDVVDAKNLIIKSFNYKNQLQNQVGLKSKTLRGIFFDHHKLLIETLGTWKKYHHYSIFKILDLTHNTETVIPGIIPESDYDGLIYDGFFIKNGIGAFYINYYYNSIISIDSLGAVHYRTKTIDNLPLPTVKVSDLGWATYSGDVKLANFSATTDSSFLYILSNVQQKISANLFGYYIDLYDLKTGKYHGSFLLPQVDSNNPGKICFFKNKLYVLYKNTFACYHIKFI